MGRFLSTPAPALSPLTTSSDRRIQWFNAAAGQVFLLTQDDLHEKTLDMLLSGQENLTEAENSQTIVLALSELRKEVSGLTERSQTIASSAEEAEVAAREAQKGAEIIASACAQSHQFWCAAGVSSRSVFASPICDFHQQRSSRPVTGCDVLQREICACKRDCRGFAAAGKDRIPTSSIRGRSRR